MRGPETLGCCCMSSPFTKKSQLLILVRVIERTLQINSTKQHYPSIQRTYYLFRFSAFPAYKKNNSIRVEPGTTWPDKSIVRCKEQCYNSEVLPPTDIQPAAGCIRHLLIGEQEYVIK